MQGHKARRKAFESAADEAIAAVLAERARLQQVQQEKERQQQEQNQLQQQEQQKHKQQEQKQPVQIQGPMAANATSPASSRRPPAGGPPGPRSFKRQMSMSEAVFDGTVGMAKALHRAVRDEPLSVDGLAGVDSGDESDEVEATTDDATAKMSTEQSAARPTGQKRRERFMQTMLLKDKVGFFLGVCNICLSAWWLGAHPETFYYWYTFKALVLFTSRLIVYRRLKYHYYLFEYCYIANVLLLLRLWVFPHTLLFHKMIFAAVSGPLTWSIPALRNSLVLHSLDQITSLFSHLSPAMTVWTLRWHPPPSQQAYLASLPAAERAAWESSSFWELGVLSMLPYLAWAVFYYLKIFVVSERKIQERGYGTLFKLMTENRKTAVAKVVLHFSKRWQPIVYMTAHLIMCWFAMTTSVLWWRSMTAHTVFVMACFAVAVWNGANYYFEIFARRYASQLEGGGGKGGEEGTVELKQGGMTVKKKE